MIKISDSIDTNVIADNLRELFIVKVFNINYGKNSSNLRPGEYLFFKALLWNVKSYAARPEFANPSTSSG
ncbi:hypothetical protein [Epilithonimonas arachidiradicis]|uniref:Uncharacterized protein n=1 Tax=Epilithonimonas arachidiradicis TaxID=1617282 RepID=A0ABQ1WU19_9FLAO|nr:hypothetical protein [Epilithonimonas arachidiradicis]GGG43053.1 hypothetical protein GCM10007332_00740 [Epilithonimonas arachidiradicis]